MEKQNPPAYTAHTPVAGDPVPVAGQPVSVASYTQSAPSQHSSYVQPQQMMQPQEMHGQSTPMNFPAQPYGLPQTPQSVPGYPVGHSPSPYAQQAYEHPPQAFSPQPQHGVEQPGMIYQQPQTMHSNSHPGYVSHNSGGIVTQQPVAGNKSQGTVYQTAIPLSTLNESAAPVDCPSCHQRALTSVSHVSGQCTHLWALAIFATTCCLCCVPYLFDVFKDTVHKCSKCGVTLATYKKSGGTQVQAFS